jgi:N-acetylmuramoyl-L-alanine amidase
MAYVLQEQYTSKNQVPGPSADSVWHLGPRVVKSITIHHWGDLGQQFPVVRDFLCTNNTPTSAHYVAEDGLVACIVSPDDCAFHAGNAEGNTFSVGIECRPEATDGDYQTVAELIANLRGIYGDIPLHPHNYWFSTACPGVWDLARLDALARSITPVAPAPAYTPDQQFFIDLGITLP